MKLRARIARLMPLLVGLALLAPLGAAARQSSETSEKVDVHKISVEQLKQKLARNESVIIVDVRGSDYDTSDSKIKGAVRIQPSQLELRLGELPRDQQIVTYCACPTDGGSVSAARVLIQHGYKDVVALRGGWKSWVQAGGEVESK